MVADSSAQARSGALPIADSQLLEIPGRVLLAAILVLAAVLDVWKLNSLGYANTYYAAAVKSMLQNWHNFFFVSFDPGGFVTIDKPPLGFWTQTASAKVFGFSGMSILLPEAIAGVLSVALLYHLVARTFGRVAGLLAALALAISPISVVTNRDNTIDSLLVLTVLLAAWAVLLAAETGKLRYVLLTAVLVGLGFNIKMMEAYLVVPALGAVYLLGARVSWRLRIAHLVAAAIVLVVVSFAWITAVDLTPASQRPFVGSSANNSEFNLAFGYNGLERLTGNIFHQRNTARVAPANDAPAGGFFVGETGASGPLRLLNTELGSQIGWLLVFAVLGFIAAAWQTVPRLPPDARQRSLVLWGVWLLTTDIFFSVAGFFHTYYLSMVAPSIAALFGIGAVVMWQQYRSGGWRGWMLPFALVASALVEAHILTDYPSWSKWLSPLVVGLAVLAAIVLIAARLNARLGGATRMLAAAGAGMLALLLAPAVWAQDSVSGSSGGATLPHAGPTAGSTAGGFRGFGGFRFAGRRPAGGPGDVGRVNQSMLTYLERHQGNTKYLFATTNANSAAPYILATGKPVMAMGGFSGSDPILTTNSLKTLIQNGTVRYFLLGGGFGGFGGGGFGRGPSRSTLNQLPAALRKRIESRGLAFGGRGGRGLNSPAATWVQQHCTAVPAAQWQGSSSALSSGNSGFSARPPGAFGGAPLFSRASSGGLYNCSSTHGSTELIVGARTSPTRRSARTNGEPSPMGRADLRCRRGACTEA